MPFSPDKPDKKTKTKVSLGYILKTNAIHMSCHWVVFIHVDDLEAIAGQSVAGDDGFWLCFTVCCVSVVLHLLFPLNQEVQLVPGAPHHPSHPLVLGVLKTEQQHLTIKTEE